MKILQLRFKNLNSLAGEWSVDFTAPGYLSDGIFAISGPTGSGKSTILDAICLALFGQTPRLGRITITSNEIMSRQTGECFAEVVFRTNGIDYICHWSQQKARKMASGNLQQPRHEISLAESGRILADKLTEVRDVVEECTGMDFNRFTQSMMLAQGGFAVFLQASPGERAPILEQITGTEIYSNISKYVFEKQREERTLLDQLKAEMKGVIILSEEEEKQLDLGLTESQEKAVALRKRKKAIEDSIAWLTGIDMLEKDFAALAEEEKIHACALAEFEPQRQVLDSGLKAAAFEGEYASLTGIRKLQEEDLRKLKNLEEELPGLEGRLLSSRTLLDKSQEALRQANRERETELNVIRLVRQKDQNIAMETANLQIARSKLEKTEKEAAGVAEKKKDFNTQVEIINEELERIGDDLLRSQADTLLVTELAGIKEQIRSLKEVLYNLEKAKVAVRDADRKLKSETERFQQMEESWNRLKKKSEDVSEIVSRLREEKQRLLGDRTSLAIQSEIGALSVELAKLQKIADYETERAQLADDVPCPLCGSLHHPWAEGNVPGKSETEKKLNELTSLALEAEQLDKKLNDSVLKETEASDNLMKAGNSLNLAALDLEMLGKKLAECLESEKDYTSSANDRSATLLQTLIPLGLTEIPGNDLLLDKLYSDLEKRKKARDEKLERKIALERQINGLKNSITGSEATLEALNRDIDTQRSEISGKTDEIAGLTRERQKIYGSRNTDEEERKINARVEEAEKYKAGAEVDFNNNNLKNQSFRTSIDSLRQSTEVRSGELKARETEFIASLQMAGFDSEGHFTASRLSREEKERLSREKDKIDSRTADIRSRKKELEKRLKEEKAKEITTTGPDELQSALNEIGPELTTCIEKNGALAERKSANEQAKAKNRQMQKEIEAQQAVYGKWFALNALIGSADGKKFRNFAQGLTFDLMVSHANRQLERLTDRYLLIRDEEQPLELNVIDNYQAGEIRTTKNLSGGESFIVSLALALGLSQMSSRKVRVDSLFLDEGFGTLDEETLDTALETLASLKQDGKLIGVISHVAVLKDRINTRITVQPVRGGKSILHGPGVTRCDRFPGRFA